MKLQVEGMAFGYHEDRPLFQDISFELKGSEILALIGPNGVGKTTLLKCLLGLIPQRKGQVRVKTSLNGVSGLWQGIAYVPQRPNLVFPYSVLDLVLMGRAPHKRLFSAPDIRDRARAMEALEMVGIPHLTEKPCTRLSGGELQLALIARALAAEPEIIVLDEPETHLDLRNQLTVLTLLERLSREKDLAVVFSTHHPEHALWFAHKVLLLGHGWHAYGEVSEVITEENLEAAFGAKVKMVTFSLGEGQITTLAPLPPKREEVC
ncbi:ABC transporter ATP-binding protein [Desulfothermobacter acidiphilus]